MKGMNVLNDLTNKYVSKSHSLISHSHYHGDENENKSVWNYLQPKPLPQVKYSNIVALPG